MSKCIGSLLVLSLILFGCSQDDKSDKQASDQNGGDTKTVLNIKIIRIEQEMFENKSPQGIKAVMDKYPAFSEKFLKRSQYPHDSILINAFYQLVSNKAIDTIYRTCNEFYGDFSNPGLQLQETFENIKNQFPGFKYPTVYTVITGMGNDMLVSDSMVVIGLEFFLAEKSRYAPQLPGYMLRRYRKEYIVPMITAMISNKYNETDYLDNSLIAEMVYYGKSYYFMQQTMPSVPDSIIAGYSKEVLDEVEKNEGTIWTHFLDKKILFETKHEIVNRYTGERPFTYEIGNKCPGRIGRWVGWQIVKRYMENNSDMTLAALMREKDAKKIFNQSKYKPKKTSN